MDLTIGQYILDTIKGGGGKADILTICGILYGLYEVVVGRGWTIALYKIKPHIDL